jgi:large subunit ribosomal protein L4e
MRLKLVATNGTASHEVELPEQFSEEIREDLVKKAVLAIQNNRRQAYGSFEDAGDRHASWVSKRRRDWRGSYGKGISRVPRKVLNRRGSQFYWVGAQAPGTVGGRRAHPPRSYKAWDWKLNVKEKRKAIRSAMAATVHKDIVAKRGHLVPESYPFIIDDAFEQIHKTKELEAALSKMGFEKELERVSVSKVRAGRGKLRGRSTKQKKSVLFVVSNTEKLSRAAENLPGIDVINVRKLNAESLAPGGHLGRATLYTHKSIEELRKGLFTKDYNGSKKAAFKSAVLGLVQSAAKTGEKVAAAKKTLAKKKEQAKE